MAYLPVSFAFRCPQPGTMFSQDYHRCIHPRKSNVELKTNTALKPIRNRSRWHFALRRPTRKGTNTQITPVIPTVQIVTNRDIGLADVGQKVAAPKGKDHARKKDSRKRRMTQRIRRKRRRGRTARIKQPEMMILIM